MPEADIEAATGAMLVTSAAMLATLGATLDTWGGTTGIVAISGMAITSGTAATLATSTDSPGGHGGGMTLFLPPPLAHPYPFTSIPPLNLTTVTILPGSTILAPPYTPSKKTE